MYDTLPKEHLHSWLTIDMGAIARNITFLSECAKRNGKDFMLMVKADAYGHGLLEAAQLGESLGAVSLGTATLEEAVNLRQHNVQSPILLFTEPSIDAIPLLRRYHITPVVGSLPFLQAVVDTPDPGPRALPFHLKINSGLNRYGFNPAELPKVLAVMPVSSALEGVATHYSSGDNPRKTRKEFELFWDAVKLIRNAGHAPQYIHASNSAATAWFNESHTNLVRLGMAAFGLQPTDTKQLPLVPALSWHTRLTALSRIAQGERVGYGGTWRADREGLIGVMPIGYSDGFRRTPNHQRYVLCRGKQLPIIGNVMMNHTILDLTDAHEQLAVGDEIVILGHQGTEHLSLEMIAQQLGTSNEEVATSISARLQRFYLHAA